MNAQSLKKTAILTAALAAFVASIPHAQAARISLSTGSQQTSFGGVAGVPTSVDQGVVGSVIGGFTPIPAHTFTGGTLAIRSHINAPDAGRIGLRVALTLDGSGGNYYDAESVRLAGAPVRMLIFDLKHDAYFLAPYMKMGLVSLSMTRPQSSYITQVANGGCTSYGNCYPPQFTTTIVNNPNVTLMAGYVFAGLRAHSHMTRRLTLFARAAVGTSIGGSVTGMGYTNMGVGGLGLPGWFFSQSQSTPKDVGIDYGYGMRYRVAPRARVRVGYSDLSLPIRGAYLNQSGWTVGASYSFR